MSFGNEEEVNFDELIGKCVQYANDLYQGNVEDQQKASDFFFEFIHDPYAFIVCLQILNDVNDLYSNYAALNVFNAIVSESWSSCDPQNREELKNILFEILQSDRSHSIINMCSILIARIAIIEFPESWENFLIDNLHLGNSLVLIYYLEDLENNIEIPQNRRILAHQVFISSFDDIFDAIFNRFDISAGSIRLYSLISQWTPLKKVINKDAIELLTTVLIESENTRENAIECLDIIFVQRSDSKAEFPRIHHLLLTNLYEKSKKYCECAVLLAKILCAHLDFFAIASEVVEKVAKIVEPIEYEIDQDGEEVLVFNISKPCKQEEITKKKYMFFDAFKNCFMLLSNPGWCLTKNCKLYDDFQAGAGEEEEEENDDNEGESFVHSGGLNGQSNEDQNFIGIGGWSQNSEDGENFDGNRSFSNQNNEGENFDHDGGWSNQNDDDENFGESRSIGNPIVGRSWSNENDDDDGYEVYEGSRGYGQNIDQENGWTANPVSEFDGYIGHQPPTSIIEDLNDSSDSMNKECDENDDNDGCNGSDDDDDSSSYSSCSGPELYWSTWNKFLSFASNLDCDKEDNFMISSIPFIYNNMTSFVLNAADDITMINKDAQQCYLTLMKNDIDFVMTQLESQGISPNLFYVTCCCLECMDFDYANEFITRFFVEDDDPILLSHIMRCMSFLLRYLPENEDLIQFFIDMFTFSIDIQPLPPQLEESITSSLMFLSSYSPNVYYFNDFALFKILTSLISDFEIGPQLGDQTCHSLFIIAARVISNIIDDENSESCIDDITKGITSFIYDNCKTVLNENKDSEIFTTFMICIKIISDFSQRCYKLAQFQGIPLLEASFTIIASKSSKENELELIDSCYELCASIITCNANWIMVELPTKTILKTALDGEKSQFGFALNFLTKIHRKFPESISLFPVVYEKIVQNLMSEIVDGSQFVLDYLFVVNFWDFQFSLPIEFMREIIKKFPLVCIKPALLIVREYCNNYQMPWIETYLFEHGEDVFRFLMEILINSMFNIHFSDIVKCFMALFLAIDKLDVDYESIKNLIFGVFDEIFPFLEQDQEQKMESIEILRNVEEEEDDVDDEEGNFICRKFLNSCRTNYMDKQKMEIELRDLVVSSHCCLPAIINQYISKDIQNPPELENPPDNQDYSQSDDLENLFDDINDEDFEL